MEQDPGVSPHLRGLFQTYKWVPHKKAVVTVPSAGVSLPSLDPRPMWGQCRDKGIVWGQWGTVKAQYGD